MEAMTRKVIEGLNVKGINPKTKEVEAILSNESRDRYDEVILSDGWELKNFTRHPVIIANHNYHELSGIVGAASSIKVKDRALITKIKFFDDGNGKLAFS